MTGRGVVAIAVLAAWGAGIAAYAQHERSRTPRERLAEIAARVAPGASYFAVERAGAHVGFASSTIDTVPGGLQVTDYLVADLAAAGAAQRTTAQTVVRLSRALALRDFTIVYGAPSQRVRATGRTVGDTLLELVVSASRADRTGGEGGDAGDTTRVRLTGPLLLPTLVPLVVALGEPPAVGRRYTVDLFDPMTMSAGPLALTIRAESLFVVVDSAAYDGGGRRWARAHADTVRGFRIVADEDGRFDTWVDALGRMITVQGPSGLSLRRTAYEVAFENWRSASRARSETGGTTDREARGGETALSAGVLDDLRLLDTLQLRIRGIEGAALSRLAIDGGGQRHHGDTVTITAFPAWRLRPTSPTIPFPRALREQHARELRAEPLLEVAHPAIAALAKRLRAREVLVDQVARNLVTWVHDSLRKEPAIALPSAVATLRSRSGDSHEHAQLFVALARAAGIPARTVSGVVLAGGRFHYHAWAEVRLQEWIGVDPTTGQFPVDASHLRLLVGGLGAQVELTRLIDRLDLSVVSQTSRPAPRASTR